MPAEGAPAARPARLRRTALGALVAGASLHAILLAPMLRQPLWLDETATRWQIDGGHAGIPARTLAWPTQSPAYGHVARAAFDLAPGSELALRLPSVAAWALALVAFHGLARRALEPAGAAAATLTLLGAASLLEVAAMARPYAFGLLALVLSWRGLAGFAELRRRRDLALWCVAAAATGWFHPTLLLGVAAQLPLVARCWRSSDGAGRRRLATAAAAGLALWAPVAPLLARVAAAGSALSFAPRPGLSALLAALAPGGVGLALLGGSLAAGSRSHEPRGEAPVEPPWRPLDAALLWTLPVAVALALALGGGLQLVFPRYLLAGALGLGLVVGVVVARLPARGAAVAVVLLALVVPAAAREDTWPLFHASDWRAAALRIRAEIASPGEPLLSITPYVESRSPAHQRDLEPGGMLLSMYVAYPVPARVHGLPSVCDRLGRERLATLWRELELAARPRTLFVIREGDGYARCLREIARDRRQVRLGSWGRLELVALERARR